MNNSEIKRIALANKNILTGNDLEFFNRVWNDDLCVYENRIKAIGFLGMYKILDAGFGFGQWLIPLALNNSFVDGLEICDKRIDTVSRMLKNLQIKNVTLFNDSVSSINVKDNTYDAIFSYGVLFLTDYNKTLKEFYRILKPGGKLYFTFNDVGWYIKCLLEEKNKSENYNPRKMAIDTISHTIHYIITNHYEQNKQLIITKEIIKPLLQKVGFKNFKFAPEGTINENNKRVSIRSFYPRSYMRKPMIHEVLAYK